MEKYLLTKDYNDFAEYKIIQNKAEKAVRRARVKFERNWLSR